MARIIPVVMCGGAGTRVWPESRESMPKQFIPLIGEASTFQSIVKILMNPAIFEEPIVVTNVDYRFRVAEQLEEIGAKATIAPAAAASPASRQSSAKRAPSLNT